MWPFITQKPRRPRPSLRLNNQFDDDRTSYSRVRSYIPFIKPAHGDYKYKPLSGSESPSEDAPSYQLAWQNYGQASASPQRNGSKVLATLAVLYLAANVLYFLSLRGADEPKKLNRFLGFLGFCLLSAVALFSIQFWTANLASSVSRRWRICNAILQLATLGIWYLVDSGNSLERHGAFNLLIFSLILVPVNAVVGLLCLWYVATSRQEHKRARRFWTQFLTALAVGSVLLLIVANNKRNALSYGFFGKRIPCSAAQRDAKICRSCQWKSAIPWFDLLPVRMNVFVGPMTCPTEDSFSAYFDDNDKLTIDCDASTTDAKSWINGTVLLSHTGPIFAPLPRTEKWGLPLKDDSIAADYNPIQTHVIRFAESRLTRYDGPVSLDSETETVLAMCGNAQPMIVNRIVVPAEVEDSNVREQSTNHERLNVVTLFIDAMSRRQLHRRLPQVREVLEKAVTAPNAKSNLYEFFRYHVVGLNTDPNSRAMWAGLPERDLHVGGTPLWEQYEAAGYTAARIDPMCEDWTAFYDKAHFPSANETGDPNRLPKARYSHEYLAWSCFPPYLPRGKRNIGNFAGWTSIKARCISGTHVGWHELDWAEQFIRTYRTKTPQRPFYLNAAFLESHEGSGEVLATLDERLARFLDPATAPFDANNTAVVIISDHGMLMGLNYAFFQNGRVEAANPAAVMMLPKWYTEKHGRGEKLAKGTERLVTAHDMYETMRGFKGRSKQDAEGDGAVPRRGVDLLRETVGERSCAEAGITERPCMCL